MQVQCAAARRAAVRSPPRGRVSRTHPVARADAERASCAAWPVRYALGSSATDTRTSQKDRIVHSSCSQRAAPGDPAPRRCALFPPCPRARAHPRVPRSADGRDVGARGQSAERRAQAHAQSRPSHRIASHGSAAGPRARGARAAGGTADVAGRHSLKKIKIKRKGKARGEPSQEEKRTGRLPPRARGSTRASGYNE